MTDYLSLANAATLLGIPSRVLRIRADAGVVRPHHTLADGEPVFHRDELAKLPGMGFLLSVAQAVPEKPVRTYRSIDLFAGAGGLSIGMELSGFKPVALSELDKHACATLRANRPKWNVLEGDMRNHHFARYEGAVDLVTGGFPCQSFSYAGKKLGLEDARGTLFFEMAKVVRDVQPAVMVGENVRGLLTHDGGRTLDVIAAAVEEIGYTLFKPRLLKAINYRVPQKRERLFLVAVREDLAKHAQQFAWPEPDPRVYTVRDALLAGALYSCDVPTAPGQAYPPAKAAVLAAIPAGKNWTHLPVEAQKAYMGKHWYEGGGKTGVARRLHWDEPSLTLTCSPAQRKTERCHPDETRPLTVREYARIQTFPDDWAFSGSVSAQYKQIGNAVPVNLAHAVGSSVVAWLNRVRF